MQLKKAEFWLWTCTVIFLKAHACIVFPEMHRFQRYTLVRSCTDRVWPWKLNIMLRKKDSCCLYWCGVKYTDEFLNSTAPCVWKCSLISAEIQWWGCETHACILEKHRCISDTAQWYACKVQRCVLATTRNFGSAMSCFWKHMLVGFEVNICFVMSCGICIYKHFKPYSRLWTCSQVFLKARLHWST